MGAAMKSISLTKPQVIASVAEMNGLKNKQVKSVVEALFGDACTEIKKNGNFKLAGMLNLKMKEKVATPAKKGANQFTKEPCVFNARGTCHEEVEEGLESNQGSAHGYEEFLRP